MVWVLLLARLDTKKRAPVEQKAYAGVSRAGQGSYDEQQIFQGQTLNENTQHEYIDLDHWTEYTYCLTAPPSLI
jgi:hypothetical protein